MHSWTSVYVCPRSCLHGLKKIRTLPSSCMQSYFIHCSIICHQANNTSFVSFDCKGMGLRFKLVCVYFTLYFNYSFSLVAAETVRSLLIPDEKCCIRIFVIAWLELSRLFYY